MNNNVQWHEALERIKSIIRQTELEETIKWGTEVYTYEGKNVVSCGGFKNFFSLWFYNGVFLKDKYKVLVSAQEGETRTARILKIEPMILYGIGLHDKYKK